MSDKKTELPEEDIEKPLDAAKTLLMAQRSYRELGHDDCDAHFEKIQSIVLDEFHKHHPPRADREDLPRGTGKGRG